MILKIVIIGVVAAFLILAGPLAAIWSLNTLFPVLNIPYSFTTWLAMFALMTALREGAVFNLKSKGD